mgnify:CR=1 FL=1
MAGRSIGCCAVGLSVYAALYSGMTDSKVMVLCCCAAGNVYPLSRATDYKPPHDVEYYDSRRRAAHSKFFAGQVPWAPEAEGGHR